MLPTLGADMAKARFPVELKVNDKLRRRTFDNNPKGFAELDAWLIKQKAPVVHACMEATGIYSEDLALHLYQKGHTVSVVNPARVKYFGQSELLRNKDDQPDAALIRRFCEKMEPRVWAPPPPEMRELRSLSRHLESLQETRQQLLNQVEAVRTKSVEKSLRKVVKQLDAEIKRIDKQIEDHIDRHPHIKQMRDQLVSIAGIAHRSATKALAEIENIDRFNSARELAAYAGLTPRNDRSGTMRGKTRMSKTGNGRLRKALFLPALTAKKYNPIIARFCKRMERNGLSKMAVIGAAMRKLIHMIYGILKSGKNFDPNYDQVIAQNA